MVERFTKLFRLVSESLGPKAQAEQNNITKTDEQKKSKDGVAEPPSATIQQNQPTAKRVIIVDSQTEQIVEDKPSEGKVDPRSLAVVQKQLPPGLPADIIRLAAQNKAFFQGVIALQRMNLDEDLFREAVEDLKKKYYKEHRFK